VGWVVFPRPLCPLRDPSQALDAYSRSIELNDQAPGPWGNLGRALSSMGEFETAVEALAQALVLNRDDHALRLLYGGCVAAAVPAHTPYVYRWPIWPGALPRHIAT
jgi:tetratricopeptide (TPR) repeat protein